MMKNVNAGVYDFSEKKVLFTATAAECEEQDYAHDGIIPANLLAQVEKNELLFFVVYGGRVVVWQFDWKMGDDGVNLLHVARVEDTRSQEIANALIKEEYTF